MNTIGERIAYLRESKNMTQRALMETLKISNLGRIEKNERTPGIEIIIAISNYFDVPTDWILKGETHKNDVNLHQQSSEHNDLLSKLEQLSSEEQSKIAGIIEGMLLSREMYCKKHQSSNSATGEESATDETA